MRTAEGYKTKQRALVERILLENSGRHMTAEELAEALEKSGSGVGRTTVYRCLERLEAEGRVQKYAAAPGESACYQYLDGGECREHFHLKCVKCGRLFHLECSHMNELAEHISAEHHFEVDKFKTVLYGICEDCAKK